MDETMEYFGLLIGQNTSVVVVATRRVAANYGETKKTAQNNANSCHRSLIMSQLIH